MGQNFHKIEAVRLEGGDSPPPKAASLTAFFQFFFDAFPKQVREVHIVKEVNKALPSPYCDDIIESF